MITLILVGFVAGIIAGISPCILPVLPIILVASASPAAPSGSSTASGDAAAAGVSGPGPIATVERPGLRQRSARPVAIVLGLVVSFAAVTLIGTEIISALGLPDNFLRDAGLALLYVFGLGLLVPKFGDLLERPFARFHLNGTTRRRSGFVLGLGLGTVFAPCAGPVLATIVVVGATHRIGWDSVALTVAFALGCALPLLIVAIAGSGLGDRVKSLRRRAPAVRGVAGVVLIVMAILIGFNVTDGLQTAVPGYTSALQHDVEGGTSTRNSLSALETRTTTPSKSKSKSTLTPSTFVGKITDCTAGDPVLEQCGAAPNFLGITAWLNTKHDAPLTIKSLRGKVVLVDFWTYSCINCQRSLPHVEAWYSRYSHDGFVVVGVHTPEFAFEHVVSNVRSSLGQFHIVYPVAVDDSYDTWTAYDNEYWPADYLIDAKGEIRYVDFGEGGYGTTEQSIRELLLAAHPGIHLPGATDVANTAPTMETTPETYLGAERLTLDTLDGAPPVLGVRALDHFATPVPTNDVGFGGEWTFGDWSDLAGPGATIGLHFVADDVYLVLGGTGTVTAEVNGKTKTIEVSGIPKLYTMFSSSNYTDATLTLHFTPGISAYDFTFG